MCGGSGKWDSRGGSLRRGESSNGALALVSMESEAVSQSNNPKWYAVQVRSRHEDVVARHLRVRGLEAFLPLYRERHRWSDRCEEVDLPLFPGYVFCQFNPLNRLPVLTVPGVVQIVGAGKTLLPIDDSEIAAIQSAVKSGLPTRPSAFLEIGQKVRIDCGPLCGIEGILLGFRGHQRLVLSITLLQRSVAVEINGEWIRPISLSHGLKASLRHPSPFRRGPQCSHASALSAPSTHSENRQR